LQKPDDSSAAAASADTNNDYVAAADDDNDTDTADEDDDYAEGHLRCTLPTSYIFKYFLNKIKEPINTVNMNVKLSFDPVSECRSNTFTQDVANLDSVKAYFSMSNNSPTKGLFIIH
jgi:hypothetical protein